jgi:transposase
LIAPQGAKGLADLLERTFRPDGTGPIPSLARAALAPLVSQVMQLQGAIKAIDAELLAWHRQKPADSRREGFTRGPAAAVGSRA